MPHLTLEYSANLRRPGRFSGLCRDLAHYLVTLRVDGQAVFPPGGVRVRAICCEDYCIADGRAADDAFVHAIFKIDPGRNERAKRQSCEGLFDILKAALAEEYALHGLALSLEVTEFSADAVLKHNNLHARY